LCFDQNFFITVKLDQGQQALTRRRREIARQIPQLTAILGSQRGVHARQQVTFQRHALEQSLDDACIGHVNAGRLHSGCSQAIQRQLQRLQIRLESAVAIDLSTELQGFARGVGATRACVQHRPAIAQACDALAIEQMRVDARHLRCAVGAQAHHAPRELIDQFESLQVECLTGPRQQGLQMLQQGWHHQLVAIATRDIEQVSSKFLDVPGFRRQDIGNVIRQDPGRHVI